MDTFGLKTGISLFWNLASFSITTLDTSASCQRSPLRRHSFSAPARVCLARLDRATKTLGDRVQSLTQVVKSSSSLSLHPLSGESAAVGFPPSTPEKVSVGPCDTTMVRTCHGCHAPLGEEHQDHPAGRDKCQLEHWDGCRGGIVDGKAANGSDWRGCPDGYKHVEEVSDGSDTGDEHHGDVSLLDPEKLAASTEENAGNEDLTDKNVHLVTDVVSKADLEEDEDVRLLRDLESTNLLLKQQAAVGQAQEKSERERKIAMLRAENSKLTQSMKGDIGGAKYKSTNSHSVPNPKNRKHAKQNQDSVSIDSSKIQEHLSRSQLAAAEYRPNDASLYSGLDIKGIRKLPNIQAQVEMLIGAVQNLAPSLDSRPSFVPEKPATVKTATSASFSASSFSRKPAANATGREDPETSSDEDFDEAPRPGYVFRWRRDANGEKYNVEEKITIEKEAGADLVYRYVRDEATGRSYKKLVLRDDPEKELVPRWVVDPQTGKKVQMLVPSHCSKGKDGNVAVGSPTRLTPLSTECVDGFATPFPPRAKLPQLSSSAPSRTSAHLQEDKQGKMPTIVHYARECPVSWTNKITSDKLNIGLWSWSFISELLATRTGQAPPLQHGELEARMRHFLNVLEIALQPGNSSDFDNHAWRVARLYAEKVQQKVERGDTWLGFEVKYGSDSQPHELMAAEKELAVKVVVKKKEKEEIKTKDENKKRSCTTWNSSSVEGKCEYEIQNEGRSCARRHECTWCKDKGKRSLSHQRSFCRLRIAAGDQ